MRSRFVLAGVMAGGLALVCGSAWAAPAAHRAVTHGVFIPAKGAASGSSISANWSGYADLPAAGQQVSSVTGHWIVPSVTPAPPGFSATWTGIGGYNTSDLIQAGTSQDSVQGYYAWYEILPASETPISGCTGDANCSVQPGDAFSVTITNQGGNTWLISMADSGRWTYSKTLTYASTESSAEWVLEAPTVGVQTTLANVGTVHFDPSNGFAVNGGATQTIAQGSSTLINLAVAEATPSALDADGDGFNDCSYATSCPTPSS